MFSDEQGTPAGFGVQALDPHPAGSSRPEKAVFLSFAGNECYYTNALDIEYCYYTNALDI